MAIHRGDAARTVRTWELNDIRAQLSLSILSLRRFRASMKARYSAAVKRTAHGEWLLDRVDELKDVSGIFRVLAAIELATIPGIDQQLDRRA